MLKSLKSKPIFTDEMILAVKEEERKYKKIYSGIASGRISNFKRWKKKKRIDSVEHIIKNIRPRSILDVGCGSQQFKEAFFRLGGDLNTRVVGVDIANKNADIIAPAHNIPVEAGSYDFLLAHDLLEHIPECLVDAVLEEFARIADRVYFNIARFHSLCDGEIVHMTVKKRPWWESKISKYFDIEMSKKHPHAPRHMLIQAKRKEERE